MNATMVISSICAAITFVPPILPFTEISREKIEITGKHMVEADEITNEDFNVFLQLDHTNSKYDRMREEFYNFARKANGDMIIHAKDLGKMFDRLDAAFDAEREVLLQEVMKKKNEEAKEKIKPIINRNRV